MANSNGWGDGSVNNNIGWGQGANNNIGWGKSHLNSWSGATDIDGGNPPVNSVAPALSGTAQEGQTLTCSTGTWSGSPTYTYQWKRDGNNITSATNSTYTLVTADVGTSIKCTITATNFTGSATADSNTVVPVSAFTGLLDTYSGASAAYSLRQLSSTYTGNCIRVRRSSDNAEQNIGFVNNVLDEASLLTFCGAGNGFVTTWYDQSGNANNATQSTAFNQPQIVSSGAMITTNGKNSISFSGTKLMLLASSITIGASNYTSFVGKRAASANRLIGLSRWNTNGYSMYLWSDNNYYFLGKTNSYLASSSTDTTTNQLLLTGQNSAGTMAMFKNGNSIASSSNVIVYSTIVDAIGGASGNFSNCNLQENILYNSDQSTNRTGIESNINTFYTIY
jgi:hypothetical protein